MWQYHTAVKGLRVSFPSRSWNKLLKQNQRPWDVSYLFWKALIPSHISTSSLDVNKLYFISHIINILENAGNKLCYALSFHQNYCFIFKPATLESVLTPCSCILLNIIVQTLEWLKHIYIYIYIYTHTHTHIYVWSKNWLEKSPSELPNLSV